MTAFLLADFYKGATINNDYIDFYNEKCPCCKKVLPKNKLNIDDVGAVSGFYSMQHRAIFMYALCKGCTNEMVLLSHRSQSERSTKAQIIEKHVLEKMHGLQLA